jgi:hypothetical protein
MIVDAHEEIVRSQPPGGAREDLFLDHSAPLAAAEN